MSINKLWMDHLRIDFDPSYQREGGVWSLEKKQLFLDSIFNGYDVPKLYFNEFEFGNKYLFAVIDGKQRLTALLEYIGNEFALAEDFAYSGPWEIPSGEQPRPNQLFRDLTPYAQEVLKSAELHVTKVSDAGEDDIEALFARLNNGEPLNSAESRNAIGGSMAELVRDVAERPFFEKKVRFKNTRFSFREVSCKFLYIEDPAREGGSHSFPDLKKKNLDNFVKGNKELTQSQQRAILKAVDEGLRDLAKCFHDNSPELAKQSYPQFYYLWLRELLDKYTHRNLHNLVKEFLPKFSAMRVENNARPEEARDISLVEFGRLAQQGTNDGRMMEERARILTRYLLIAHPEITVKDARRAFTQEERYAIWVLGDRTCVECGAHLADLSEMDADHFQRHVDGGKTEISNARCLCRTCNRRDTN